MGKSREQPRSRQTSLKRGQKKPKPTSKGTTSNGSTNASRTHDHPPFQPGILLLCVALVALPAIWDWQGNRKLNAFCEATRFKAGVYTAEISCLELRCPPGAAQDALWLTHAQIAFNDHCVPEPSKIRGVEVFPLIYEDARDWLMAHRIPTYLAASPRAPEDQHQSAQLTLEEPRSDEPEEVHLIRS
ncbi:MAG: hypothetical protein AAGK02_09715, partial [Pseudomonadota bacterium]